MQCQWSIQVKFRLLVAYFPEIVVSRKCAESLLRGADVFVPGVIGCSPKGLLTYAHLIKPVVAGDEVSVLVDIHDRILRAAATQCIRTGALKPSQLKGRAKDSQGQVDSVGRLFGPLLTNGLPSGVICIGRAVMSLVWP